MDMFQAYVQKIGFLDTFSPHVRFGNIMYGIDEHAWFGIKSPAPFNSASALFDAIAFLSTLFFKLSFRWQ
jgi:hypothetical protein